MATGVASTTVSGSSSLQFASAVDGPQQNWDGVACTMCGWTRPSDTSGTAERYMVVIGEDNSTFDFIGVGLSSDNDEAMVRLGGVKDSGTVLTANVWQYWSVSRDASNNWSHRVNGVEVNTGTNGGSGNPRNLTQFWNRPSRASGNTNSGPHVFLQFHGAETPGDLIYDLMYNPYSVAKDLLWAPDLQKDASAVGDYLDRSGNGWDPNAGTVESTSALGPPVHLFAGGM